MQEVTHRAPPIYICFCTMIFNYLRTLSQFGKKIILSFIPSIKNMYGQQHIYASSFYIQTIVGVVANNPAVTYLGTYWHSRSNKESLTLQLIYNSRAEIGQKRCCRSGWWVTKRDGVGHTILLPLKRHAETLLWRQSIFWAHLIKSRTSAGSLVVRGNVCLLWPWPHKPLSYTTKM